MEKQKIGIVITKRTECEEASDEIEIIEGYLCYSEVYLDINENGSIHVENEIQKYGFELTVKRFDESILEVSAGVESYDARLISKALKNIGYKNKLKFNDLYITV